MHYVLQNISSSKVTKCHPHLWKLPNGNTGREKPPTNKALLSFLTAIASSNKAAWTICKITSSFGSFHYTGSFEVVQGSSRKKIQTKCPYIAMFKCVFSTSMDLTNKKKNLFCAISAGLPPLTMYMCVCTRACVF